MALLDEQGHPNAAGGEAGATAAPGAAASPLPASAVELVVLGDGTAGIATGVVTDLTAGFPRVKVRQFATTEALVDWWEVEGSDDSRVVPLIAVTSEIPIIDTAIRTVNAVEGLKDIPWLLVSDRETHNDVAMAMQDGELRAVIAVPWKTSLLVGQTYTLMRRELRGRGLPREDVDRLLGPAPRSVVKRPLITGLGMSNERVVETLLEGVERVLGRRTRLRLPEGVELTEQGKPVTAVHLVVSGRVALLRDTDQGVLTMHHATSGPLIGLVSLVRGDDAFFTARVTERSEVIRLTDEQLGQVITQEPRMSATLAVLAMQSLARRLVRAENLHAEQSELAAELEMERTRLALTLQELRATRAQLVEGARLTMLGELSGGIAHELNNPVAAISRSGEHVLEDVRSLIAAAPELEPAARALEDTLEATPRSTRTERQILRDLLPAVDGDRAFARRLLGVGVTDPGDASRIHQAEMEAAEKGIPGELEVIEAGARIGTSLRSIRTASGRVTELTKSLRAYSRPIGEGLVETDVEQGIADVLVMTKHNLHDIAVERDFAGVPHVQGQPAKMQQVWTNLIVNAGEAFEDERHHYDVDGTRPARGDAAPTIWIRTSSDDEDVTVTIRDNGPGVPEEIREKIFQPHFTTKSGQVRYGLGMGLSIVRSIVEEFGGAIDLESVPGRTQFTITLPLQPPEAAPQAEKETVP